VRHRFFSHLDQIRDQVVTAFKLHLNLCETVLKTVFQLNQTVVNLNQVNHQQHDNSQYHQNCSSHCHSFYVIPKVELSNHRHAQQT
jgi:hypothetical protein